MSGGVSSYSLGATWITQSILSLHQGHAFIAGGDVKVTGGSIWSRQNTLILLSTRVQTK